MTIREVERRSGLERGNIRFYEREGLIEPVRQENGYRDYSEDDLALLLKIRLLRRLGFSLEAIRAMSCDRIDLEHALAQRLGEIEAERRALDAAEQVCACMRQDGVVFSTLDAQRYLDEFDRTACAPGEPQPSIAPAVPRSDFVYPVREPWRRCFARMLDQSLAGLGMLALFMLLLRVNVGAFNWFEIMVFVALFCAGWVPVEALLISRFRTTPGKWLLGLYVEHIDGRPLTWGEALWRALAVFVAGCGCGVPGINALCGRRAYRAVEDEGVFWDADCALLLADRSRPCAKYAAAAAAILAAGVMVVLHAQMPIHRGVLTVEEFVDNYNDLARFYGDDVELRLDGTLDGADRSGPTALSIETADGIVTGVSYEHELVSCLPGTYADDGGKTAITLSAMALIWADSGIAQARSPDNVAVLERFADFSEGTLEWSLLGYHLTYTIESDPDSRAEPVYSGLTERRYSISFAMRRDG